MKIGKIHDHHSPHNNACPQNQDASRHHLDCACILKSKRERKPDIINRAKVREKLLKMAGSYRGRDFTQVKPSTLDAISSHLEAHLKQLAQNAPRVGKTL